MSADTSEEDLNARVASLKCWLGIDNYKVLIAVAKTHVRDDEAAKTLVNNALRYKAGEYPSYKKFDHAMGDAESNELLKAIILAMDGLDIVLCPDEMSFQEKLKINRPPEKHGRQ